MIPPARAPVRPRVISPFSGEKLLLEDAIASLIERGQRGRVWLHGEPRMGKSTALAHLAAILPAGQVSLRDGTEQSDSNSSDLILESTDLKVVPRGALVFHLAKWGDDELIEYLLSTRPDRCASVMRRCQPRSEREKLRGAPEMWREVLDLLADDETLPSVTAAVHRVIDRRFSRPAQRESARKWCLALQEGESGSAVGYRIALERDPDWPAILRLLSFGIIRTLLAVEAIVGELQSRGSCGFLKHSLAAELIQAAAPLIAGSPDTLDYLRSFLVSKDDLESQGTVASLLHAGGIGWRPERKTVPGKRKLFRRGEIVLPNLDRARLPGANWPQLVLSGATLTEADLSGSCLAGAMLDRADLNSANLFRVKLTGGTLTGAQAIGANLAGADLAFVLAEHAWFDSADCRETRFEGALLRSARFQSAKLNGAQLARANLACADFTNAVIDDADFTQANLEGAHLPGLLLSVANFSQCSFRKAHLQGANLEEMSLPGADFAGALLNRALLTASSMPAADFRSAYLVNAGLAEVDWERADLREADLRGASFHMGSSRSGLVDSTIASYGSRTGFYTDDYGEQDFKSPEEIRKANLRGADLRGANIEGVDFYLVDLRDALYDDEQERQFRGCGAILESRVG